MVHESSKDSLLYVPDEFLACVWLEAAAQHQLGIPIQAGFRSVDKPPASSRTTVARQLLSTTEPARVRPCQPPLRPKSAEIAPEQKAGGPL